MAFRSFWLCLVVVGGLLITACSAPPQPTVPPAPTFIRAPAPITPGIPTVAPTPAPRPTPGPPTVPPGFRITLISEQPKIGTAITRDSKYFYVAELLTGN